VDLNKAGV